MAYAPIAKIEKFIGKENNAQRETEAVTTYLGHFYKNLHQIQVIQADYFTAPQILNQFIHGLHSSLLQCICPMHPQTLQNAVTNARDFESAELKASHAQAVNLVINRLSELDSKLKQFTTITNNELLAAIFPFELEKTTPVLLFSEATLDTKPITAMYTNVKVDGHAIKLILDSGLAGNIITKQLMDQLADGTTKTSIGEIDDFPIEINSITVPIKVLVIEATQYQALIGNNWLFKTNTMLNWNTQKLQLSQNGQHTQVPATCDHFKTFNTPAPFIEFEEEKEKPTWKAYQVSWMMKITMNYHLYFSGTTMAKGNRRRLNLSETPTKTGKITTTQTNYQAENEKKIIRRKKKTYLKKSLHHIFFSNAKTVGRNCLPWELGSCQMKITEHKPTIIVSLATVNAMAIQKGKARMCDTSCQYMILISDWISHGMQITAAWHHAISHLDEGATLSEILEIKNNPPEPVNIVLIPNPDAFLDLEAGLEKFYEHYQNLAPTREKQKQQLEEINTRLCDHCLIPCDFQYCNECDLIYNLSICMIYIIPEEEKPINSCRSESESVFNPNSNFDNDDNENNGSSSAPISNKNYDNLNSDSYPKTFIALPDLTKEQELKWFSNNDEGIIPECAHDIDAEFDLRYPRKNSLKLEPHSRTCIDLKIVLEILTTIMQKKINIRGGIIDTEYVGNIIAMLQNNSEKAYIIDPNKKIAQTIFLPLETRKIQGFGSMGKIDISVNMAEEKIYMLAIKREVKDQAQLFETKTTICETGEIGFTNLYMSAKSSKNIKISIYNTTGKVIKIPKRTIIGYLTTQVEDQPPNHIPDFPQLCEYVDITSQIIYG
ncbi:hypothetical protein G9A89_020057 [Geosiphon pyriformis]|nr:hypothetical protein G9A89_020057 [Geosiphon pyriformis]